MTKEQLGTFIAENRRDRGLTQRDLAERLHITDKAVSKWERGLSYPDVTLLEPLAEVFGLGVEELVACEKREEEQPVKTILEISRESRQSDRRRAIIRTALSALVIVGLALLVFWYSGTNIHEEREDSIFLKETVGDVQYLYVEQEGHLLRLRCGDAVDFDAVEQTNERGKVVYRLDCRWNRKTYRGVVNACTRTEMVVLGGMMDVDFMDMSPAYVNSLFGYTPVLYTLEKPYPDPFGAPRGQVWLWDYRFYTGELNEKRGIWETREELLHIEDCMNVTVADFDGDGANEVIARTRWPEKPYTVYKRVNGEIISLWPETVSPEIQEALLCMWEEVP